MVRRVLLLILLLAPLLSGPIAWSQPECYSPPAVSPDYFADPNFLRAKVLGMPPFILAGDTFSPLAAGAGVKFAWLFGYPVWLLDDTRLVTNFFVMDINAYIVEPPLRGPEFTVEYLADLQVENGTLLLPGWSDLAVAQTVNGTAILGLVQAYGALVNLTGIVEELGNETVLPVPLLTFYTFEDTGRELANITLALSFALPEKLRLFLEQLLAFNATITNFTLRYYPLDGSLTLESGGRGVLNVVFTLDFFTEYVVNGSDRRAVNSTVMIVHGQVEQGGLSSVSMLELDIRDYGAYRMLYVIHSEGLERLDNPVLDIHGHDLGGVESEHVGLIFVYYNGSDTIPEMRYYRMAVVGDAVIVDRSVEGAIESTDITGEQLGPPALFYTVELTGGPAIVAVVPGGAPTAFVHDWWNLTAQKLQEMGLTYTPAGPFTFLPIVWGEKLENGTVRFYKAGLLALSIFAVENTTSGEQFLLVVPYLFADEQLFQEAPQVYKRIYNNGTQYLVRLPRAWQDLLASYYSFRITGWRILGFTLENSTLEPILAASFYGDAPDYTTIMESGLSLSLPWLVSEGERIELANGTLPPTPEPRPWAPDNLSAYITGPSSTAFNISSPPDTWISLPVERLNVSLRVIVDYDYPESVYQLAGGPFLIGGTLVQYQGDTKNFTYSYGLNNITGTPALSYWLYDGDTGEQISLYFANNILPVLGPEGVLLAANAVGDSIVEPVPSVNTLMGAVVLEPSDLAPPLFNRELLMMSRLGYMFEGVILVGPALELHPDSMFDPANTSVLGPTIEYGFLSAEDVYTVIFARNTSKLVNESMVLILDALGNITRIVAYTLVNGSVESVTICDGNCQELQVSDPCGVIRLQGVDGELLALEVYFTGTPGTGGGGGYAIPQPEITFPGEPVVSSPGLEAPRALMTLALFIVFYVYFNQRMSNAAALAVTAALTGVLSVIVFGPVYLVTVLVVFAAAIALFYVLGK